MVYDDDSVFSIHGLWPSLLLEEDASAEAAETLMGDDIMTAMYLRGYGEVALGVDTVGVTHDVELDSEAPAADSSVSFVLSQSSASADTRSQCPQTDQSAGSRWRQSQQPPRWSTAC